MYFRVSWNPTGMCLEIPQQLFLDKCFLALSNATMSFPAKQPIVPKMRTTSGIWSSTQTYEIDTLLPKKTCGVVNCPKNYHREGFGMLLSSSRLQLNHISDGGKKGTSCLFYFDFKAVVCCFPCSYMTYEPSAQGEPPQIECLVGKLHLVPCKETNLLPLLLSLPRLTKGCS